MRDWDFLSELEADFSSWLASFRTLYQENQQLEEANRDLVKRLADTERELEKLRRENFPKKAARAKPPI
jgi:cell division protein FtsB